MPIRVILQDGKSCPAVFCDYCGLRIEKVGQGNYHWNFDEEEKSPQGAAMYFTHKKCCLAFDRKVFAGGAMELGTLFAYLCNSLGVDLHEERQQAAFMDRFEL
jgi:hypothetical protein